MRTFKFKGFDEEKGTFYGEGDFTVGKIYVVSHVDEDHAEVPALQIVEDDNGWIIWEEKYAFEEVFE